MSSNKCILSSGLNFYGCVILRPYTTLSYKMDLVNFHKSFKRAELILKKKKKKKKIGPTLQKEKLAILRNKSTEISLLCPRFKILLKKFTEDKMKEKEVVFR